MHVVGIFWLIHIFICCIITKLQKTSKTTLLMISIFIPFFGIFMILAQMIIDTNEKNGIKEIELEKLSVSDVRYKQIRIENEKDDDIVVPLEEALLINDADTRRRLMLDILQKNPDEYVDVLKKAQISKDVEIVHYATTTMMEVQSEYEIKLQNINAKYVETPLDINVLDEYITLLDEYIKSNLISGNLLTIQRIQLEKILKERLILKSNNKRYVFLQIENKLKLKNYDNIEKLLTEAKKAYQNDEKVYMFCVYYYRETGRSDMIEQTLKEVEENEVYLSRKGKEWYQFWNN